MAENDNEEREYIPKPFPKELVETPDIETVAHQVRDYLWGKGPVEHANVSAHMKREFVSKCVEFEMPGLPPQLFWRVRILVDLYALREHLAYVESLLNRQEAEPVDLDRSIACTIILDEIGDEARKERAVQYYEYLVAHRLAGEKFEELIQCLGVLGNQASAGSLKKRIDQETKLLASREAQDPDAGVRKRNILGIADNELFFVDESNKARRRISDVPPEQRLKELIYAYLLLTDDGGAEYFDLWTQQQIRRTAEADGNDVVINAFRAAIGDLDRLGAKDKNFCKIRALNAIEFFLGKWSIDESEFMEKHRGKQTDPLRLIEVPIHFELAEEPEPPDEEEEEEESEKPGEEVDKNNEKKSK